MDNEARDLQLLSRSVTKVEWIYKPKPINLLPGVKLKSYTPDKIVLASISRNLKHGPSPDSDFDGHKQNGWATLSLKSGFNFQSRQEEILSEVYKVLALRDDAHPDAGAIICFGELDWPIECHENGNLTDRQQEFRQTMHQICHDRNCFILGGSYHDPFTFYNKALIFSPRSERLLAHAKLRPAHKSGESVRIPGNNELRYYRTPFGNIAILICMDVFDLNIVLTLAKTSFQSDSTGPIDYILVPAYNVGRSHDAAEACERLSYFTNSTVLYVNCTRCKPYNGFFQSGTELVADSSGQGQWQNLTGSQDNPFRVLTLDINYKDQIEVDTQQKYGRTTKAMLTGVQDVSI